MLARRVGGGTVALLRRAAAAKRSSSIGPSSCFRHLASIVQFGACEVRSSQPRVARKFFGGESTSYASFDPASEPWQNAAAVDA